MSEPVIANAPVYSAEPSGAETMDSVLAKTHPHWTLIVVDDGSVAVTTSIVAGIVVPRLRYVFAHLPALALEEA